MLKFYVLCSKEVNRGREKAKATRAAAKSRPQYGKPQGRRTTEAYPRPDYRKEDDRL